MIQGIVALALFFLSIHVSVADALQSSRNITRKSATVHAMKIGVCHFLLHDVFGGRASDGSQSLTGPYAGYVAKIRSRGKSKEFSVQFECSDQYAADACYKFKGQVYALGGTIMDPETPIPVYAIKNHANIKSINGSGVVLIYDEIADGTGKGNDDGRNLSFCLASKSGEILVGLATVMESKKDVDITKEVVELLKGIEFKK